MDLAAKVSKLATIVSLIKYSNPHELILYNQTIVFLMLLGCGMVATSKKLTTKPKNKNVREQFILENRRVKYYDLDCPEDREELLHICEKYPDLRSCTSDHSSMPTRCQNLQNLTSALRGPELEIDKKISKRATDEGTNLCTGGSYTQKVLIFAYNQHGQPVELVQYPFQHLFHTYFTRECYDNPSAIPPGMTCKMQSMKVEAIVYDDYNTNPNHYEVQDVVVVPVVCSLTEA